MAETARITTTGLFMKSLALVLGTSGLNPQRDRLVENASAAAIRSAARHPYHRALTDAGLIAELYGAVSISPRLIRHNSPPSAAEPMRRKRRKKSLWNLLT